MYDLFADKIFEFVLHSTIIKPVIIEANYISESWNNYWKDMYSCIIQLADETRADISREPKFFKNDWICRCHSPDYLKRISGRQQLCGYAILSSEAQASRFEADWRFTWMRNKNFFRLFHKHSSADVRDGTQLKSLGRKLKITHFCGHNYCRKN